MNAYEAARLIDISAVRTKMAHLFDFFIFTILLTNNGDFLYYIAILH